MSKSLDELFTEAEQAAEQESVAFNDDAFNDKLKLYRELSDRERELSVEKKSVTEQLETLEAEIIRTMEEKNWRSIKRDGIGTFSLRSDSYPKVLDLKQLVRWLIRNGHGGLAKTQINWNTLRSWVREQQENERPLPPPTLLDPNPGITLSLRR